MSLIIDGVTHGFTAGHKLLDDLTASFDVGQSVAITAPSGAGKTTLLHIIGGLLTPHSGQIMLGDTAVAKSGADLRIGWVLQTSNLLGGRSALDNVALPLLTRGSPRNVAETKARERLGQVRLAGMLDQPAKKLSGGEAQRVGIARALVVEPELLLADEPTANLDPHTAREVGDLLFHAGSGTILIVVTHDPMLAAKADRHLELVDGKLVEHDPTLRRPQQSKSSATGAARVENR